MDGDVKAIPLAGIVHNETKIGVQDGMLEDLVNMRFKDGSWRTSDPGNSISLPSSADGFSQFYIHTNVYRHLLGVKNGGLYWTAIIDADGNFYIGNSDEDDTPEHTTAHEVFYGDGDTYNPVLITEVTGEVKITQTGHLITVIDEEDDFEHYVFKTSTDEYIKVKIDVSGEQSDRTLYPFGQVHFNFAEAGEYVEYLDDLPAPIAISGTEWYDDAYDPRESVVATEFNKETMHDLMVKMYGKAAKDNHFTRPFLAVGAIKLYDGSYLYTSNPTLVFPNETAYRYKKVYGYLIDQTDNRTEYNRVSDTMTTLTRTGNVTGETVCAAEDFHALPECPSSPYQTNSGTMTVTKEDVIVGNGIRIDDRRNYDNVVYKAFKMPTFSAGMHILENCYNYLDLQQAAHKVCPTAKLKYYDLCCSVSGINELFKNNQQIFQSFCIFITPEVDTYEMATDDADKLGDTIYKFGTHTNDAYGVYCPQQVNEEKIAYKLAHSNFYLLREYDAKEIFELSADPRVKMTNQLYEGVLANITAQDFITSESITRTIYLPRVAYNYNGRLHIADYKTRQFHGYPLELFMYNNHSVKYEDGSTYMGLPNMANNDNEYLQWGRGVAPIYSNIDLNRAKAPLMIAVAEIETSDGIQKVVRYIAAPNVSREDLDPIITFPDYRAKSLDIYWYDSTASMISATYVYKHKKYELKPHPYLNLAYYFDVDNEQKATLKPIKWADMRDLKGFATIQDIFAFVEEENVEEYFPNGLKVSSAENPMYFPAKNTYQVGSAEILALCSNTIAVGTGQTGEAPLYVFCKDGVYALFVDASGQMAYPNARAIARDVLNNPKSVTPIDAGVVFTTERGLMMIAGEQVQEIGQPLEGDYNHFIDANNMIEYNAIAKNAYTLELLAGLADNTATQTDFLTFLKGSVLNYNHNEWELMVSNPEKQYTYILDKHGNWSRRNYSASEYINNYPSSYRFAGGTTFWQVDKESDADNGVFIMTREIKLNSIGFKSLQRVVARGFYSVPEVQVEGELRPAYLGLYVFGSHDSRKWACLGHRERPGTFTDIGCLVERTDCKFFRVVLAGRLKKESRLDYIEISSKPSVLNTKIR